MKLKTRNKMLGLLFIMMMTMTGIVSAQDVLWERHTIVGKGCVETTSFYADHTYGSDLSCPVAVKSSTPYIDVKIYDGEELVYWKENNELKLRVAGSPQDGEVIIPGQIKLDDDFAEYMKIHASIFG